MSSEEKLRALLTEARAALSQGCWNGKCCAVRARIDAALAEPVGDDFKRGAEAMREAAAKACEGVRSAAAIDNWIWVGCHGGCVDAIRALPVPKDKP